VPQDGNGGPPQDAKQSSSKTDDDEENASLQQYKNHCNATGSDKRGTKNLWDKMRAAVKDGRDPSAVTDNNAAARSTAASASAALAQQPRLCDTFVASDTSPLAPYHPNNNVVSGAYQDEPDGLWLLNNHVNGNIGNVRRIAARYG